MYGLSPLHSQEQIANTLFNKGMIGGNRTRGPAGTTIVHCPVVVDDWRFIQYVLDKFKTMTQMRRFVEAMPESCSKRKHILYELDQGFSRSYYNSRISRFRELLAYHRSTECACHGHGSYDPRPGSGPTTLGRPYARAVTSTQHRADR